MNGPRNFHAWQAKAKRWLPGFAFGFAGGGVDDEVTLRQNQAALDDLSLVPLMPRLPAVDARPVVLVLVEDKVCSLASLLLAADIAAALQARLHVAHIRPRRLILVGTAGVPVPASLWAEADCLAAAQLREKAACLLALTSVEWTFTWTVGSVHRTAMSLIGELSPIGVVIGAPRRHSFSPRRSVARWLISRPNVPTVVALG